MRIAPLFALVAACHGEVGAALDAPSRAADAHRADAQGTRARRDWPASPPSCARLVGARMAGGAPLEAVVREGSFVALDTECALEIDLSGRFVAPAFVDSHVHLAYDPRGLELARSGVAAAIDLAAPQSFFATDLTPLRVLRAGPMITAPRGYPTQSWGAGGYGIECDGLEACMAAVDRVIDAGAELVKVPLGHSPELDDATLRAVIARAHARERRVVVHALGDDPARRAASAGADILAHTPVEPLSELTVRAWSGRAVISTLAAFGGSEAAIDNLRRLREAGATVLYGTDLGNTSVAAIDGRELALLARAGLDPAAIVASGTSVPALFFGLDMLGALEPGRDASFLVLDADPSVDPSVLTRPLEVVLRGRSMSLP